MPASALNQENLMKAFAVCVAFAAAAAAPAFGQELVARQGSDSVRLSDAACQSELVLARVEPGSADDYKAATAQFQGQTFVACWRTMGGVAHLVYEDGDQGIIPMQELKPALSA
jgi:hypothetical protein